MLGFDKYFENKTLLYSAGAVAFLVAALLILFIFRLAFGRRLHMPGGGRARQPRLGIVDAFDLDRQRQLVLVRRDNVEHLVMIGGPNDVLIESQIVRAEARDLPRPRDKEPSVASLNWPASGPMSLSPSSVTEPRLLPEDTAVAARDLPKQAAPENAPAVGTTLPAAPVKLPAATPPSPRPPFLPLPPRRPITMPSFSLKPTPRPAGDAGAGSTVENGQTPVVPASSTPATKTSAAPLSRPPRPPPANPSAPNPPAATPQTTSPSSANSTTQSPLTTSPLTTSPLTTSPLSTSSSASPLAPPVTPARPVESEPSTSPAIVPSPETPPETAPKTKDAIESLEEEMAKLLGRDTKES